MKQFNSNGLVWWCEEEIIKRDCIIKQLVCDVKDIFFSLNPAINIIRIETPCLEPYDWKKKDMPCYTINNRYSLRAESTRGTYRIMDECRYRLPVCLYQVNKSFRDETSKAIRLSHYRLREFYQLEFQLFYTEDTKCDYHTEIINKLAGKWGRQEPSDTLPNYSVKTTDLIINNVEIASISTRKDYKLPVLEISFGLDRLVLCKEI